MTASQTRRAMLGLGAVAAAAAVVSATLSACGDRASAPLGTGETALAAWRAFYVAPTDRVPRADIENPGTPFGDYVGSASCRECHADEYERWRMSFHSKTLYKATPKTVFGDFSGKTTFDAKGRAFRAYPLQTGDRFAMRIDRNPGAVDKDDTYGGGIPEEPTGYFEVLYAFGNRRDQPYVTRAKDGRHWVLPVVWDDRKRTWAWDGWRPYVKDCAGCHTTGLRTTDQPTSRMDVIGNTWGRKWNVAPQEEGWADGAVGCENCHGPGRAHQDAVRKMGAEAYRARLAAGGPPTIYNPRKDTPARRQQQCDTCHTFLTESPVSWSPSPAGYGREPSFELLAKEVEITDGGKARRAFNDANYYADLSEKTGCTVSLVFGRSLMAKKGVECRDCHDPHGAPRWAELKEENGRNQLCLKCHRDSQSGHFKDDAAVAAHTRHRIDGPGSLCVECHMPRDKSFTSGVREQGVVQFMTTLMHSHAMSIPTGRESEKGGPPTSCNYCHTDRDAAWTQKELQEWKR